MIRTLVFSAICTAFACTAIPGPALSSPNLNMSEGVPPAAIPASREGLVAANPGGEVTVLALLDYEDVGTQLIGEKLKEFTRRNPDIQLVVRPLAQRGPLSTMTAKAAYAAARQGKFAELHDALLHDPGSHTWLSIRNMAPLVGLNWDRFQTDFESPQVAAAVEANVKFASGLKLQDGPVFIAGERVWSEPWNKVDFARLAQEARAAKAIVTAARTQ